MSYRITIGSGVEGEVCRVAGEQIDKAARELNDEDLPFHERIHQVRKRLKKVRGVLRLVRPALGNQYSEANIYFRDLGRQLAGLRDAEAMVEAVEGLIANSSDREESGALEEVRRALAERRKRLVQEKHSGGVAVDEVARELDRASGMARGWELRSEAFQAVAGGVRKTYSRGRAGRKRAFKKGTAEAFHEWRKRVKYHWLHVRLLREAWPEPMKARRDEAKRLAGLLGDDHDLAVLGNHLTNERKYELDPDTLARALLAARKRSAALRAEAAPLGAKLFAEAPKQHIDRLGRLWNSGSA